MSEQGAPVAPEVLADERHDGEGPGGKPEPEPAPEPCTGQQLRPTVVTMANPAISSIGLGQPNASAWMLSMTEPQETTGFRLQLDT